MFHFSRLTIRTKLILIIMGITVGVLLVASAALIGYDAHTNRENTQDYLNGLAESVSTANAEALVARDTDFSQQALRNLQDHSDILFACIFDEQGRYLSRTSAMKLCRGARECPRPVRSRAFSSLARRFPIRSL